MRAAKVHVVAHFLSGDPQITTLRLTKLARLSVPTVRRYRRLLEAGVSVDDALQRPRTPSHEEQRRQSHVLALAAKKKAVGGKVRFLFPSCAAIAQELRRSFGLIVSRQTVWRDLHRAGWVSRVRPNACTVKAEDKKARVRLCRKHVLLDPATIMFTDETMSDTNCHVPRRQWGRKGAKLHPRLKERWPGKVMVHGAIGVGFRDLVVFPRDCRLNAIAYKQKVLHRLIPICSRKGWYFQNDGARPHIAEHNMRYIANKGVERLPWPARSPMLNPIEQLWARLHMDVAKKCRG